MNISFRSTNYIIIIEQPIFHYAALLVNLCEFVLLYEEKK